MVIAAHYNYKCSNNIQLVMTIYINEVYEIHHSITRMYSKFNSRHYGLKTAKLLQISLFARLF